MITDSAKTITFTVGSIYCGPSIEYQVTYSPTSTTPNLISLPASTIPSILFATTNTNTDIGAYTVTVSARPVGATTWTSSATATYTYRNPCVTATLITNYLSNMTNSVLNQTNPEGSPIYATQTVTVSDSVSISQGIRFFCGNY